MLEKLPQDVLLLEMHLAIEAAATRAARELIQGTPNLSYPPNFGLTENERVALQSLAKLPDLESALRKVVASAAAWPIFHLFCLADGIAGPAVTSASPDMSSDGLLLHDAFYDSYWAWRKQRPNPGWRLDSHDG